MVSHVLASSAACTVGDDWRQGDGTGWLECGDVSRRRAGTNGKSVPVVAVGSAGTPEQDLTMDSWRRQRQDSRGYLCRGNRNTEAMRAGGSRCELRQRSARMLAGLGDHPRRAKPYRITSEAVTWPRASRLATAVDGCALSICGGRASCSILFSSSERRSE
ncbi:hypothetical protein BD289DRAFT_426819 [Coniella lustricola]|uniref:Uncharacterized protein n=1 Tax=Coniella lustricola TaxID=2025994 RepID=A0A2T3AFX0_9PEZI|nr:hypothetical protein BD289DRAFT_426819 [Coniella lustricola]